MNNQIYLAGNAHLDVIWLWRWQEGCGEVLQTFRSTLDRLNEYDDFVFTCSSAAYYRWVEEIDPAMFAEIAAHVREGRWVPVNGWWVQPDCNIPAAESYARHALYSQLYYLKKFGRICKTGWNVDSFGHNAMLPQMLKLSGMSTYVMMRPQPVENPGIPEGVFWWESPDGTRVLTYRIHDAYGVSGPERLDKYAAEMSRRMAASGHSMLLSYGVGNHGGGPTKADIEHLRKQICEGNAELRFSDPDAFFANLLQTPIDYPVWADEMQHHASGCYSAMSLVKALNRKAENALASAEKWNTLAAATTSLPADTAALAEAWRNVCFNQFHDTLCGCSIWEAYEDVKEITGAALAAAAKTQNHALIRLARNIDTWLDGVDAPEVRHQGIPNHLPRPIVVFNPLSFPVKTPMRTYHPSQSVCDAAGQSVLFQNVRSSRSNDTHEDTLFLAEVPALGYATYWLTPQNPAEVTYTTDVRVGERFGNYFLENAYLRVEFNKADGSIARLIDKKTGFNLAREGFARPTVIEDRESDTWAHRVFRFDKIAGTMQVSSIELVERGPLRAVLRIKHTYNTSTLTQDFVLASHQKTLRVKCKALWQEPFTLLKMPLALAGKDEISTYEIPSGFLKRPCNGEEEPGLSWADLTVTCDDGKRRGVAVISDSKYSYDCPNNELRLTLLRNVIFADHDSHRPPADFSFTDEGLHRFAYGLYVHEGEAEDSNVVREAALFVNRPVAVPESYHKGTGEPQVKSFLSVGGADNVIVTALKYAEDGSGARILRCYEANGKKARASFVCEALNAGFYADFTPFQTKTFRIETDGSVKEVDFLEGAVIPT